MQDPRRQHPRTKRRIACCSQHRMECGTPSAILHCAEHTRCCNATLLLSAQAVCHDKSSSVTPGGSHPRRRCARHATSPSNVLRIEQCSSKSRWRYLPCSAWRGCECCNAGAHHKPPRDSDDRRCDYHDEVPITSWHARAASSCAYRAAICSRAISWKADGRDPSSSA